MLVTLCRVTPLRGFPLGRRVIGHLVPIFGHFIWSRYWSKGSSRIINIVKGIHGIHFLWPFTKWQCTATFKKTYSGPWLPVNPIRPGPCNFGRPRPINVFHDDSLSFQPILMKQTRKESWFRLLFHHPSFTSNRNSQWRGIDLLPSELPTSLMLDCDWQDFL